MRKSINRNSILISVMGNIKQFIIIDDDPINNFICREIIGITFQDKTLVRDFTKTNECLDYLRFNFQKDSPDTPTVLFVDINMPQMTGWEFLDNFEALSPDIKKMFRIYIVSSSISPLDRKKAEARPYVTDFITKPITEDFLLGIAASDKKIIP
jgi:CheY-like chemotaxis protein